MVDAPVRHRPPARGGRLDGDDPPQPPAPAEYAEPFERYPQYYPARLMQAIVSSEEVPHIAESGLRASARPDALVHEAARRIKQPTVGKAAWSVAVLDETTGAGGPSPALRETAAALLQQGNRQRTESEAMAVLRYHVDRLSGPSR